MTNDGEVHWRRMGQAGAGSVERMRRFVPLVEILRRLGRKTIRIKSGDTRERVYLLGRRTRTGSSEEG